jgi:hypothetical protein
MRTKLPLVALAFVVLAGGLLWALFGSADGHAATLDDAAASMDTPAALHAPAELRAAESNDENRTSSRDAVALDPNGVAGADTTAPTGIEIRPVVGAERRRVDNVELWWIAGADRKEPWGDPRFEEWLDSGVLEERMAENAVRIERDADGKWRLPKPALVGAVVASAEGLWALQQISRTSLDPTYVTLEPDLTLTARVVDLGGAPVQGVHVALRQDCGEECTIDHAVVATDADGFARFRHYRALIDGDWDYEARYGFSIAEPLAEPVRTEFELTQPTREVVTLVLPPTGSVVLQLGSNSDATKARLEARAVGEVLDPEEDVERNFDGEREVLEQQVRFPFVGLGREVIPLTICENSYQAQDAARSAGPVRAGQEVVLRLESRPSGVLASGRVLDSAGEPQRHARCFAYITGHDGESNSFGDGLWTRTDAEGRFEMRVDRHPLGATKLEFLLADDSMQRQASAELTFDWPAGALAHDVGNVRVEPLPVVLEGWVVDGQGRGLEGASIRTWVRSANATPSSHRSQWEEEGDLRARSGAKGHFVIRSSERVDELMLVATSDGACSSPTHARAGTRDFTLVASHDGVLRGRIVFDESLSSDHIQIEVEPDLPKDSSQPREADFWLDLDLEGKFLVRGVRAGLYTVHVHLSGVDDPVATVKRVRVEAGSESLDPRLDPLDLRKLGRWRDVRVLEADGTPAREWTTVRVDPQNPDSFEINWHSGPCFRLESGAAPLWLCTADSLAERIDPATVGDTIRLSPAPHLRVITSPDSPWPADASLELLVSAANDNSHFEEYLGDGPHYLAQGTPLDLRVHHLGALKVTATLQANDSAELPCEIVRGGVLAATSGVHMLEIRWTQEALDKALAEARE